VAPEQLRATYQFRAYHDTDASAVRKFKCAHYGAKSNRSALDLTEREQDVVALAAKGLTNRETATKLYIIDKAVEYHMGNVFGKLGISSRRELRQKVAD